MTTEPEQLDLRSHDIAADKRDELLRLFPEIRTEDGLIDFNRLRLLLGETVDVGKERYGMTWPGKADCFKAIQTPSMGTLLPRPDESVKWETTENLIIEGDNLEVLKLLQKSYLGKVKMIYIDPPYNTGNDFIYPDSYSESLQTYLEYTGQVDAEGKKFNTNSDTDGRFHSKWLNMMYPRLYLARNLLREDGVIFISMDDNEIDNLRKVCGEIFGEENFLGCVTWQKKYAPANDKADFSATHDYLLVYARSRPISKDGRVESVLARAARSEAMDAAYSNPDDDPRGPWKAGDYTCNKTASERPNLYYPITQPKTKEEIWPKKTRVWGYGKEFHARNVKENRVWWGRDSENQVPAYKRFLSEVGGVVADTVWLWGEVGHTDEAKKELKSLFEEAASVFDTPKPVKLLLKMLALATEPSGEQIVLDFFAGSGTTAQAVLQRNAQDGGSRRFILVQLPEPTLSSGHSTIAEITKERVRRAIKHIESESEGKLDLDDVDAQDRGFRVFGLAESNFRGWQAEVEHEATALAQQLDLHIDHVRDDREPLDVLFEILLKNGFPLTAPIEMLTLAGKQVYSVAAGGLLICLEADLTIEVLRGMAELGPERITCLDESFAKNDQLKANAVQIFKSKGIVFRTV